MKKLQHLDAVKPRVHSNDQLRVRRWRIGKRSDTEVDCIWHEKVSKLKSKCDVGDKAF